MSLASYTVPLSCPSCGSKLAHCASQPSLAPDRTQASAWCSECGTEWRIDVVMTPTLVLPRFDADEARGRAGDAISNNAMGLFS